MWPGLHQKPTMQACVQEHYLPNITVSNSRPRVHGLPDAGCGTKVPISVLYLALLRVRHIALLPAHRGARETWIQIVFICTVYMDESPPGMLASLYSTRLQRRRTAREAPSPRPCSGHREVSSCLRSPEPCRHWHVEAHRDASQGAGLLTTIRRQLKHSLRFCENAAPGTRDSRSQR